MLVPGLVANVTMVYELAVCLCCWFRGAVRIIFLTGEDLRSLTSWCELLK